MTPARSPRWMPDHAAAPAASAARIAGQAGMSQVSPVTKAARHAQIAGILEQAAVLQSQDEPRRLAGLKRGVRVTQDHAVPRPGRAWRGAAPRGLGRSAVLRAARRARPAPGHTPGLPHRVDARPAAVRLTAARPDGGGRVSEAGAAAGPLRSACPVRHAGPAREHGGLARGTTCRPRLGLAPRPSCSWPPRRAPTWSILRTHGFVRRRSSWPRSSTTRAGRPSSARWPGTTRSC